MTTEKIGEGTVATEIAENAELGDRARLFLEQACTALPGEGATESADCVSVFLEIPEDSGFDVSVIPGFCHTGMVYGELWLDPSIAIDGLTAINRFNPPRKPRTPIKICFVNGASMLGLCGKTFICLNVDCDYVPEDKQ